jgi:hypothetical protein
MHVPSAPLNDPPTAPIQPGAGESSRLKFWIITSLLIAAAVAALIYGIRLRRDIFFRTAGVHFQGDVRSAWRWGDAATRYGLLEFYELNRQQQIPEVNRLNDYTPLRLAMATAWTRWTYRHFPGVEDWRDDYDFTWPMLTANTVAEALSGVLVFLLIWVWVRRASIEPSNFTGIAQASLGTLLFWFNPAVLWDGHCWPQWDVWLVPFFIGAVLLASVDWWFMAGASLVVGAFLKGQLLLGAPVLLVWPLVSGRFGALLRMISGGALMTALLALPWMLLSTGAIVWCICVTLAVVVSCALLKWYRRDFALMVPLAALMVAIGVFLSIPMLGASDAWFTVGFKHGTEKFATMMVGNGAYNVPRMLIVYDRWPKDPTQLVKLPGMASQLRFDYVMRAVYGLVVLICGIGAAWQARRRDARFLSAMVAPWVCFPLLLTQMHGRYLVWGAAMSALLAALGVGPALLGLLVSLIALMGIVQNQYLFVPDYDPETLRSIQALDPHIGWATLLVAAILVYLAVTPGHLMRKIAKS